MDKEYSASSALDYAKRLIEKCPKLVNYELIVKNSQLLPNIDNDLCSMVNLRRLYLKEQVADGKEVDKTRYNSSFSFSVNLKVAAPAQFKLILDYQYFTFNFDQFLQVIKRNTFKYFEAHIGVLKLNKLPETEINKH